MAMVIPVINNNKGEGTPVTSASGSKIIIKNLTEYNGDTIKLIKGDRVLESKTISGSEITFSTQEIGLIDVNVVEPDPSNAVVWKTHFSIKYYSVYEATAGHIIYGFRKSRNDSNPGTRIEYLEDAIGMEPAFMNYNTGEFDYGSWRDVFFMPKPCMLNFDGTVDYYLDPEDYTKKVDGTPSDIEDITYNGNVMVEFPKIWVKRYEENGYEYTYIANYKVDTDYYCFSNLDANGNEIDHFYVSAYKATIIDDKLRSISGQIATDRKALNIFVPAAEALNTKDHIWYITQWCDRSLINDLLVLISKSTDTQTSFGMGYVGETSQSSSSIKDNGLTDSYGFFFGSTNNMAPVKVFGIENYWGNVRDLTMGLVMNSKGIYGKMTWSQVDGSTYTGYYYSSMSSSTVANYYTKIGTPSASSGGLLGITATKIYRPIFGSIPYNTASGQDNTLYECDSAWINQNSNTYVLETGGCLAENLGAGAFYMSFYSTITSASRACAGTSLSCKPIATI